MLRIRATGLLIMEQFYKDEKLTTFHDLFVEKVIYRPGALGAKIEGACQHDGATAFTFNEGSDIKPVISDRVG
jgi:hypothetical protein